MGLNKELEIRLKEEVMKYLIKGRPGWDVPHTLASVDWMKRLIKKEGGDYRVLVSTMYLHDIGYFGVFMHGCNYDSVETVREEHMRVGAKMAKKITRKLNFSKNEINEISHLISVHDSLDVLSTNNEILVMEADSLAQIDQKRVPSRFGKEGYNRFIENFQRRRAPRFRTNTGIQYYQSLIDYAIEIGRSKI